MVLLAAGIDLALRVDPDPILASRAPAWTTSSPGAWSAPTASTSGPRCAAARPTGCSATVAPRAMSGCRRWTAWSTTNCLVDELEVDADGNFEMILSADEHEGTGCAIDGRPSDSDRAALLLRLGHRGAVVAADRARRRRGRSRRIARSTRTWRCRGSSSRWATSSTPTSSSSCTSALRRRPTASCRRSTAPRWARPPRTGRSSVVASWSPTKRSSSKSNRRQGVYWSYSLGNPWWETIHYGRHQSSLNGHQAVVDSTGSLRVVIASARIPGVANWLDTAGHSNGPMILRCVRTETAPVTDAARGEVRRHRRRTARRHHDGHPRPERAAIIDARRRAVQKGSPDDLLRRRARRRRARRDRARTTSARPTTAKAWSAPSRR